MKTKRKFINVVPKSKQAKQRFKIMMDSLHGMVVEQETDNQLFVTSINKMYGFWMNKKDDPHWMIIK